MEAPWSIRKYGNEWMLIERMPPWSTWSAQVVYGSRNWQDCVDYMNAVENGDMRKMFAMNMERATLCKGFR